MRTRQNRRQQAQGQQQQTQQQQASNDQKQSAYNKAYSACLEGKGCTVLEAAREAEDGIVAFLRTQEQENFLIESVRASKRSVDLSMIQYREGLTDYQRVLDTPPSENSTDKWLWPDW